MEEMKNRFSLENIKSKGFTLVELLLVIAIIGILASVLFVGLTKQRQRARITAFKENMRGLVSAATACRDARKNLTIYSEKESNGNLSLCADSSLGIANIPKMVDCDGKEYATITTNNPNSAKWQIVGTCHKNESSDCVATCGVDGCSFTGCE